MIPDPFPSSAFGKGSATPRGWCWANGEPYPPWYSYHQHHSTGSTRWVLKGWISAAYLDVGLLLVGYPWKGFRGGVLVL